LISFAIDNTLASVTQLYAFFYTPNPTFPSKDGWSIYSPREEFGRMGVGMRTKAWRFTDINKDYSVGDQCWLRVAHTDGSQRL
jgi:hypothetical protein